MRQEIYDFRCRTYAEQNGHRATAREKEKRMETKDYLNYVVHEIHRTIVATVDDEGLPITAAIDMTACPVGAVVRG